MTDLKPFEEDSADHLRLVIDTGQIGIWELDLRSGRAWRNRHHDAIFGYSDQRSDWSYDDFLGHVVEADRTHVDQLQKDAIADRREWLFECRILTEQGSERWISASGKPLLSESGEVTKLIGHVIDITDTRVREERLALLTEELNHRVRNMLSMIKSLVQLSARNARDIPTFASALEGRVAALARTQDLFANDPAISLTPSNLLEREIAAFSDYSERVTVSVEAEPKLRSSLGQSLSLVFHELVTNAIKYGAFSNQAGRIDIRIAGKDDEVTIVWHESGGPPVVSPRSQGFGSKLIEGAIGADGTAEMAFEPDGLRCTIRLDLERKPSPG